MVHLVKEFSYRKQQTRAQLPRKEGCKFMTGLLRYVRHCPVSFNSPSSTSSSSNGVTFSVGLGEMCRGKRCLEAMAVKICSTCCSADLHSFRQSSSLNIETRLWLVCACPDFLRSQHLSGMPEIFLLKAIGNLKVIQLKPYVKYLWFKPRFWGFFLILKTEF